MPTPSTSTWRAWEIAVLGMIVSVGAWLRLPLLQRGVTGDETGLLQYRGVDSILGDWITTLHPPLFRVAFRAFLEPMAAVQAGRVWSLACGLATIAVLAVLTRRISGSRMAGLAAAMFCAVLPASIVWSAMFRPYATLVLLVAVHIWSVIRWREAGAEARARHWLPVVLTAVLLPQIHYITVPWLLFFGLGMVLCTRLSWRRLWVYLPAAVAFLPLLWALMAPASHRGGRQSGDLLLSWDSLLGMGLYSRRLLVSTFVPVSLAALVVPAIGWRRLVTSVRICWLGAVAILLSVTAGVLQHRMTSSTTLLGVASLVPLIFTLPVLLSGWFRRWIPAIVVATLLVGTASARLLLDRMEREVQTIKSRDRLAQFLGDWQRWVPTGHEVGFVFSADHTVARLVLNGELLGQVADPECGTEVYCFMHGGRRWGVAEADALSAAHAMTVVWTRGSPPDALPSGCTLLQSGRDVPGIVRCGE